MDKSIAHDARNLHAHNPIIPQDTDKNWNHDMAAVIQVAYFLNDVFYRVMLRL